MRDDWFRRGHRLPFLLSVSSKSCSHTFLHPLINSVARSFVNQMHLNRFFLFPPPRLTQLRVTQSYSRTFRTNPKQMQRIQLRLKEAEHEEAERERKWAYLWSSAVGLLSAAPRQMDVTRAVNLTGTSRAVEHGVDVVTALLLWKQINQKNNSEKSFTPG